MSIPKSGTGLALGGGAVLGAAHIGVIRALKERDIEPDYLSGTSIGALIAALTAFGLEWEEMRDIALELDWLDISGLTLSRFGLLSNQKIQNVITDHLGDVQIEDATVPLAIIATDITRGEKMVLTEGSLAEAVMASTCLPGIFIPIESGDRMLVDGGIMENVPVLSAQELGAEYVIGVDLNAGRSAAKPKNILDVLISTIDLTLQNASKLQTDDADLLIAPDLTEFDMYDTSQVEALIEKGYEDASSALDDVGIE